MDNNFKALCVSVVKLNIDGRIKRERQRNVAPLFLDQRKRKFKFGGRMKKAARSFCGMRTEQK